MPRPPDFYTCSGCGRKVPSEHHWVPLQLRHTIVCWECINNPPKVTAPTPPMVKIEKPREPEKLVVVTRRKPLPRDKVRVLPMGEPDPDRPKLVQEEPKFNDLGGVSTGTTHVRQFRKGSLGLRDFSQPPSPKVKG